MLKRLALFAILAAALFLIMPSAGQEPAPDSTPWIPFNPDNDPFKSEAAFDLRSLNEKVAGEHGFIAAKNGKFVFSANNQPVRFWAVNGIGATEREAVRRSARMLAKRGVNMVRLHGPLFNDLGNVDPAKINQAILIVEELKAEGIYTHFSIYFPLWLTPKS